jgi:hypothetical protein
MKSLKIEGALVFVLLLGSFHHLFAEKGVLDNKVLINHIETEIEGVTKKDFLLKKIGLEEGAGFADYNSAVSFLDQKIQDLLNLRVFESLEYSLKKDSPDASNVSYTLILNIVDSNNTFVIPYPKYESSNGFRLGAKTYLYNMFGTLINFQLDTNFNIDNNEAKDKWEIPSWTISPSVSGIRLWELDFSISILQEYDTYKEYENDGELLQEYTWYMTRIVFGSTLDLPYNLYYSFGPYMTFNYGITELETDSHNHTLANFGETIEKEFSNLSWKHSFGYDDVNWVGNFRSGFAAEISNLMTISSDLERNITYSSALGSTIMYFRIINERYNFSARVSDFVSSIERDTSDLLRGVNTGYMFGISGIFLNLDLNISLSDWDTVWEIQLRPFFDVGIVNQEFEEYDSESDLGYTTGADLVLYLDRWKSLQMRGTIGIDLAHFEWNDSDKYEVLISGDLTY